MISFVSVKAKRRSVESIVTESREKMEMCKRRPYTLLMWQKTETTQIDLFKRIPLWNFKNKTKAVPIQQQPPSPKEAKKPHTQNPPTHKNPNKKKKTQTLPFEWLSIIICFNIILYSKSIQFESFLKLLFWFFSSKRHSLSKRMQPRPLILVKLILITIVSVKNWIVKIQSPIKYEKKISPARQFCNLRYNQI